jgi:hypothetical protein
MEVDPEVAQWDVFGPYTYLCVCDTCEYPLNLPPETWGDMQVMSERVQWPTPFWADDSWPFTPLIFHRVPRKVWPMSHFKPAMGELKFLNWAYSFVASRIQKSCRDLVAVLKSAGDEIKRAITSGKDLELIQIEESHGKTIGEIVQFLQQPEMNGDIWRVIEAVETNFEKRTGLLELMYGESARQMRSAEEANLKGNAIQVRPDDMANKVEDAMSDAARHEALAARWHLEPQDLAPIMGESAAQWWQNLVSTTDPSVIVHQLEYRIEAGTMAKPNKGKQAADAQTMMQTLSAPFFQWAMSTGQVNPFNGLLAAFGTANGIDVSGMMLQPPPPPPMPGMMPPGEEPAQGAPA